MKFLILFGFIALNSSIVCHGQRTQRVMMYDQKGRLTTTYTTTSYRATLTETYLGSPFWGDLAWHQGNLIYKDQREVSGQVAYDLARNQVYWRLNDSTEAIQALPDEFMIEGRRFISMQHKPLGVNQVSYYEIVYDGPTKLLRKWSKQIRIINPKVYTHRIPIEDRFTGEYLLSKDLYVQKAGERPKFIIPTEYSLSRVLPNMGAKLADFIAANSLTEQVLVEALIQYDNRLPSLKQR